MPQHNAWDYNISVVSDTYENQHVLSSRLSSASRLDLIPICPERLYSLNLLPSFNVIIKLSVGFYFCFFSGHTSSLNFILNSVPSPFLSSILPPIWSTRIFTSWSPREEVFLKSIFSGRPVPLSETISRNSEIAQVSWSLQLLFSPLCSLWSLILTSPPL